MERSYDVIIAGGGVAGMLAAARLSESRPELRIVVLEKEAKVGGRLRTTTPGEQYSYGLNAISDALFEYWNETLKTDPEIPDLPRLVPQRHHRLGILAGNKITACPVDHWFSPQGARALGGATAAKQWSEVEEVLKPVSGGTAATSEQDEDSEDVVEVEIEDKRHPFSHHWQGSRKAPAAVVMEHYGSAFGIPDIWSASTEAIVERARFHSQSLHCGSWDEAFAALMAKPAFKAAVTVVTSCRIISASHDDGQWRLTTEQGEFTASSLIVAQPPWQASSWLSRSLWPTSLLQISSKTRPVSAVVLSEQLKAPPEDLPDVILVPSEKVQIVRNDADEICFQATIDFESSLQAPAVIKAVRSLKRARKKLLAVHPGLLTEGDHIVLQPYAWTQSPAQRDRRWLERLAKKDVNTRELSFCGDAYGPSYDGDVNLIRSLSSVCEAMLR